MPDMAEIRRSLLAAAESQDWLDAWPAVLGARVSLLQALAGLNEQQSRWRPPTGEGEAAWSAFELGLHVLAYSRNVLGIIEATAEGRTVPKDPMGTVAIEQHATFATVRRAVTAQSVLIAGLPERLTPAPNLEATVPHAVFGPLNCRGWFLFLRLHDMDHTRQIANLAQMPGIPRQA